MRFALGDSLLNYGRRTDKTSYQRQGGQAAFALGDEEATDFCL
jgi:hypothetical protein